jgi:hypothetical protein
LKIFEKSTPVFGEAKSSICSSCGAGVLDSVAVILEQNCDMIGSPVILNEAQFIAAGTPSGTGKFAVSAPFSLSLGSNF